MPALVSIIEGHGEVRAFPILLRRLLNRRGLWEWRVLQPKRAGHLTSFRRKLSSFLRNAELEPDCAAILILLDLDDGCPKDEAQRLAQEIQVLQVSVPVAVVFAHREYETWFLASAESLTGYASLPTDLQFEGEPEDRRGAKEWLTSRMRKGSTYKPTQHQAGLSARIDLELAYERSRSFRRLVDAVG